LGSKKKLKSRPSKQSQLIEDGKANDLKLYFNGFKEIYREFSVLYEITKAILVEKGKGISEAADTTMEV
jgi:hypothetical protein